MPPELPSGTVTFLFTDVEGSTRLLHALGAEAYAEALAEHRRVIREACAASGGVEVDTQGDAFFFAFPTAPGALAAASAFTGALATGPIKVRAGLYTGTPLLTEEGYVGEDVHRAARIAAAGHGGQVLVAASTASLVGPVLTDLGEHRFKDLAAPERVYQLGDGDFPPLVSLYRTNLPVPATPLVGRKRELLDVLRLLVGDGGRIVTLTGPGGVGKTRFSIAVAAEASDAFADGVWWVPLAPLRDPTLVLPAVAEVVDAEGDLAGHIGDSARLLVLDNLEHVIGSAAEIAALVAACPRLRILVTSREVLRVTGEREYPLAPLPEAPAVELFRQRASAVVPDLDVDYETAAAICGQLDRLPLAIELAAARVKALTPAQVLERLPGRPELLRGGRDADPRQQTLRATIEWSYELLSPGEQELFARLSVFVGGCTLEAAEEVADADLDTLQSLVEKSLVRFGDGRYRMLETIREYAAERLDVLGAEVVRRRHRGWIVRLGESSAQKLHTGSETSEAARLAAEYENVRAAVAYALEVDEPDDVGLLVGALYPFFISRGRPAEAYGWAEATLARRDRLSDRALADALAGGGELARFAGDLDRAIELKEELASMREDPHRPNWRAATLADLSEIALVEGDVAKARRYAEESAAAGGGSRVELAFAEIALRLGDFNHAEEHARSARDTLEEGSFNYACALEILGECARRAGDEASARARFTEGLRRFEALDDAGGVADCLEGLGRVAADAGRLERAGTLLGAAQGLREEWRRMPARADLPRPEAPADALEAGRVLGLAEAVAHGLRSID